MLIRFAVLLALLIPGTARADTIVYDLGHIDLDGLFTVTACCGTGFSLFKGVFSPPYVTAATGLFAPYMKVGDELLMDSPLFVEDHPPYPAWHIGGFTLSTLVAIATGAIPRDVTGIAHLTGNGMDFTPGMPSSTGGRYGMGWEFTAPAFEPYEFEGPITGPIHMEIKVGRIEQVPDAVSTLSILALGAISLFCYGRWLADR